MDLDSMKYADLQKLAKQIGVKGRMKADKLLKAIKLHYEQEKEEEADKQEISAPEEDVQPEPSVPTMFVNTRRGRGKGTKRKTSHETEDLSPSKDESVDKVTETSQLCGTGEAKKRRLSSSPENTEREVKPAENHSQVQVCHEAPAEKAPEEVKPKGIPRLRKTKGKPSMPNFKKLHEAQFKKMESIDSYDQRKNIIRSSTKKKETPGNTSMFSPGLNTKRPVDDKRRLTFSTGKPAKKGDVPFRPSVLGIRRINVRFSEATLDNEHKRSLIKTPARKSPCDASVTPKTQTSDVRKLNSSRTSMLSASKTNGTFVFTGNTTLTPGTQKKPTFDLQASLSRPLGYKPHKGKLTPFAQEKENAVGNKSQDLNPHQKNYKQHQVQTRELRRGKHTEERRQKKENLLGARRGLVMM